MTKIHSLSTVKPVRQDRFFVDSNVWFWFTYCASKEFSDANQPRHYQLEKYPKFIEEALDIGASLYHSPLVYTELANIIEKTEHGIYVNKYGEIERKKFRAIAHCRERVLKEVDQAWKIISTVSSCLDIHLKANLIPHIHKLLVSSKLDSYDALYLQVMQLENIEKLISDDGDFVETPLKDLYTANNQVLRATQNS